MPNSTTVTFSDPYEYQTSHREALQKLVVTARGKYRAKITSVELHRLWMLRGWHSLPTVSHAALREDQSPIVFPTDARQPPSVNNGFEVKPGEMVVTCLGGEYHARTPPQKHWGSLSLTADDLAAFSRTLVGRDLKAPPETRVMRPEPAAMSRLLSLHNAVDGLATTTPEILAHPEVAKAIEQELARALIACLSGTASTESRQPLRGIVMQRFEQMIEVHRNKPLYLTDVCAALGVSGRTLRWYCQELLGMGPQRYLWLRRMHLVRRALTLADPAKTDVTTIANDHGFAELGRFAVTYRQMFGEVPPMTLRRLA